MYSISFSPCGEGRKHVLLDESMQLVWPELREPIAEHGYSSYMFIIEFSFAEPGSMQQILAKTELRPVLSAVTMSCLQEVAAQRY